MRQPYPVTRLFCLIRKSTKERKAVVLIEDRPRTSPHLIAFDQKRPR